MISRGTFQAQPLCDSVIPISEIIGGGSFNVSNQNQRMSLSSWKALHLTFCGVNMQSYLGSGKPHRFVEMLGIVFPVKWCWKRVRQQTTLVVYFCFNSCGELVLYLQVINILLHTKSSFSAGENGWSIHKFKKPYSVGSQNASNVFSKLPSIQVAVLLSVNELW